MNFIQAFLYNWSCLQHAIYTFKWSCQKINKFSGNWLHVNQYCFFFLHEENETYCILRWQWSHLDMHIHDIAQPCTSRVVDSAKSLKVSWKIIMKKETCDCCTFKSERLWHHVFLFSYAFILHNSYIIKEHQMKVPPDVFYIIRGKKQRWRWL